MMFCWRWSLSHWVFVYLDLFFFVWFQWFAKCICIIFLDKGTLRKRTRKQGGEECQHIMFFSARFQWRKMVRGIILSGPFLAPLGWFWAPFWDQLGAKGLPKSTFLAPSRTKISNKKLSRKGEHRSPSFSSILAPLGRFWAPFWDQLGAKGLPKSSFLAPSRTKISKNEAQNEASKKIWNVNWN